MGNSSSKKNRGEVLQQPPAPVVSIPPELYPYAGPPREYSFAKCETTMYSSPGFMSSSVSSDASNCYGTIDQMMQQEGKLLEEFFPIPGDNKAKAFSQTISMPYQAVFSKNENPGEIWNLVVHRTKVNFGTMYCGTLIPTATVVSNYGEAISTKIMELAEIGGRFVGVSYVGQTTKLGLTTKGQADMDVDVLFSVPRHPNPVKYVYNIQLVPMQCHVAFAGMVAQIVLDFNFEAFMQQWNSQGWKMLGTVVDTTSSNNLERHHYAGPIIYNTSWVFCKEANYLEDSTPRWEGKIVEYHHKITMKLGFGSAGVKSDPGWIPIIAEMGQRGWEFVVFFLCPGSIGRGFGSATQKVLLFFQRKIIQ